MANLLNIVKSIDKEIRPREHKLVYNINRRDETPIKTVLFRDVYQNFVNKYGANNLMVRAVNNTGLFTYKGFKDNDLQLEDMEDYWAGYVRSAKEFEYWYSMEITVIKKI